jgi:hypothetical protein
VIGCYWGISLSDLRNFFFETRSVVPDFHNTYTHIFSPHQILGLPWPETVKRDLVTGTIAPQIGADDDQAHFRFFRPFRRFPFGSGWTGGEDGCVNREVWNGGPLTGKRCTYNITSRSQARYFSAKSCE